MSDGPSPDAMVALSIGTAIPGLWGFFCPGPLDQDSHDEKTVRLQQAKAGVASLGLGAVASGIAKKPWPFLVAVALVGVLMWEYEANRKRDAS